MNIIREMMQGMMMMLIMMHIIILCSEASFFAHLAEISGSLMLLLLLKNMHNISIIRNEILFKTGREMHLNNGSWKYNLLIVWNFATL